jgi:hypothetical protein
MFLVRSTPFWRSALSRAGLVPKELVHSPPSCAWLSSSNKKKKKGYQSSSDEEDEEEDVSAIKGRELHYISPDEDSDDELDRGAQLVKQFITEERALENLGPYVAGEEVHPARMTEKQLEAMIKWMERLYVDHPYWKPEDTRTVEEKNLYKRLKRRYIAKQDRVNKKREEMEKVRVFAMKEALNALPTRLWRPATRPEFIPEKLPEQIKIPLPPRPKKWPYTPVGNYMKM